MYLSVLVGELKALIERDFGSVKTMQEQLSAASVTVQGSGWGWLVRENVQFSQKLYAPSIILILIN